jgi:hypothetical protein
MRAMLCFGRNSAPEGFGRVAFYFNYRNLELGVGQGISIDIFTFLLNSNSTRTDTGSAKLFQNCVFTLQWDIPPEVLNDYCFENLTDISFRRDQDS